MKLIGCSRSRRSFTLSIVSMRLTLMCRPTVAKEVEVVERHQPLGVVDQDGVGVARAEGQEFRERALDRGGVLGDLLFAQELAHLLLAGGIADARGAAAEEHDRLAAGLLEAAQVHDLGEVADVQARRRHVEADIAGDARDARLYPALRDRCIDGIARAR